MRTNLQVSNFLEKEPEARNKAKSFRTQKTKAGGHSVTGPEIV